MAAPQTRVMISLPSHAAVIGRVKVEVPRLVGEKVLEFQEEQLCTWFGKPWQRETPEASSCALNVAAVPILGCFFLKICIAHSM